MIRLSLAHRFKLGATFAVFVVLTIGIIAIFHMHSFNVEVQAVLDADLAQIRFSQGAIALLQPLRATFLGESLASETLSGFEVLKVIDKLRIHLKTECAEESRGIASSSVINSLDKLGNTVVMLASGPQTALPIGSEALMGPYGELEKTLLDRHQFDLGRLTTHKIHLEAISRSFQSRMGILGLLTLLSTIILSIFFAKQITLPMRRLRDVLHKIRDGDYQVVVRGKSGDEIGQIFEELSHMVEHIAIRDGLKKDKIGSEKRRFAALANHLSPPLLLVNSEQKVAFANNEFLEVFRLGWDDIYEVDLNRIAVPRELKEAISGAIFHRTWVEEKPMDIIGDSYAYELKLTTLPVNGPKGELESIICILGRIGPSPNNRS